MDKKELAKIADSASKVEDTSNTLGDLTQAEELGRLTKVLVEKFNLDEGEVTTVLTEFVKGNISDTAESGEGEGNDMHEPAKPADSGKGLNLKASKKLADDYAAELEEDRKKRHFTGDIDGLDVEIFSDGAASMDDIKEQVKAHIPAIKETLTGNLARPLFGATDGKVDSLRVALSSKTGDEERIKAYDGDSYPETIGEFHFVEVENEEIHDTNYEFGDYML